MMVETKNADTITPNEMKAALLHFSNKVEETDAPKYIREMNENINLLGKISRRIDLNVSAELAQIQIELRSFNEKMSVESKGAINEAIKYHRQAIKNELASMANKQINHHVNKVVEANKIKWMMWGVLIALGVNIGFIIALFKMAPSAN